MMKYIFLAALLFCLSCQNNKTKEKELDLKEKELNLKEKELNEKMKNDTAHINLPHDTNTLAKKPEPAKPLEERKVMHMIFTGYEEGDYPHLMFKDIATGEEYDFRHLYDNKLSGIPILIDDNNAAFGSRANKALVGKKFTVEAVKKTVEDNDLDGKTIKVKDWVIASLTKE